MIDESRIILVPRWSGTPASDFYPWLCAELGPMIEVLAPPDPGQPTIAAWTATLADALRDKPRARTIVVGHSVGAQTVMRTLAALGGEPVAAAVLVAGWWDVDEPWPTIRPWIDEPFDIDAARRAARGWWVLLSDNDPFTRDFETTATLFRDRLDATVEVVPGGRHFNAAAEPAVRDLLRRVLRGPTDAEA